MKALVNICSFAYLGRTAIHQVRDMSEISIVEIKGLHSANDGTWARGIIRILDFSFPFWDKRTVSTYQVASSLSPKSFREQWQIGDCCRSRPTPNEDVEGEKIGEIPTKKHTDKLDLPG